MGRTSETRRPASDCQTRLLDEHLARHAISHPDTIAVVDRDGSFTYGEVESRIERLAAALVRAGVAHGEIISWQLPNIVDAVVVHHAILRVGGVSGPIPIIYRAKELCSIVSKSSSRFLFIPESFRRTNHVDIVRDIQDANPQLERALVVGATGPLPDGFESLEGFTADVALQANAVRRSPEDLAAVIFSSGTESEPKGVLHTHASLDACMRQLSERCELSADDSVFSPAPVTHVGGIVSALALPFALGNRVVLQDIWTAESGYDLLMEHKPTFIMAVPTFLHGLIGEAKARGTWTSPLRSFICGGAPVSSDLVQQAEEFLGLRVSRSWGSTECPVTTGSGPSDDAQTRAESDGYPFGTELRIVDTDGADVPAGTVGEIWCRGPQMMVGYLGAARDQSEAGRWIHSGDLGRLDASGRLQVMGRTKEIIIRGGQNISTSEIEHALARLDSISESAVFGIHDERLGERICAYIVPAAGYKLPTIQDLASLLMAQGLAKQKVPEVVVEIDALPLTDSGKVRKNELKALFAQRAQEVRA